MVYASARRSQYLSYRWIHALVLTDAYYRGENGRPEECVFNQILCAGSEESGRCAHLRIVVGGLEWTARKSNQRLFLPLRLDNRLTTALWRRCEWCCDRRENVVMLAVPRSGVAALSLPPKARARRFCARLCLWPAVQQARNLQLSHHHHSHLSATAPSSPIVSHCSLLPFSSSEPFSSLGMRTGPALGHQPSRRHCA